MTDEVVSVQFEEITLVRGEKKNGLDLQQCLVGNVGGPAAQQVEPKAQEAQSRAEDVDRHVMRLVDEPIKSFGK